MKKHSLKSYLNFFTIAAASALLIITIAVLSGWIYNLRQYNQVLSQFYSFTTLSDKINQAYVDLNGYIQTPEPDIAKKYKSSMESAFSIAEEIKENCDSPDLYYAMVGIENIIAGANILNQEIINQLDLDSFNDIYSSHMESQTLFNYINLRLTSASKLQNLLLQTELTQMTSRIHFLLLSLASLSTLTVIAFFVLSRIFFNRISAPVQQISQLADELANGNLEAKDIPEQHLVEFSVIAVSINKMKQKLSQMITKIREQSDIAVKLQESELENLRISNNLKNTELRVMQAQINPHFLFNTLNSISRLALNKGNEEIVSLIEALSQMLRYNLNHIDRAITLHEEIDNLKNYLYIQEVRFKDKLHFYIENHSRRPDLQMPCLTLQPIVENAIIHGLKPYNYEGCVSISIQDHDNYTEVCIRDDGIGMQEEEIQQMINGTFENSSHSVKHTSIGFKNVTLRLHSFYDQKDCILVESNIGEGTAITLKLYCERSSHV